MDFKYCKLEIFIPETHLPALPENPPGSRCRTYRELRFLYVIK